MADDLALLRKVCDDNVVGVAGPRHIRLTFGQRRAHRVQALHKLALITQLIPNRVAHAGHDAHVDSHVGRVGNLHANV